MSATVACGTLVLLTAATLLTAWVTLVTWLVINTPIWTAWVAHLADTILQVLIKRTVAQTPGLKWAVVTGILTCLAIVVREVGPCVDPVVKSVHEPFKVVDLTKGGPDLEVDIAVREDDGLGYKVADWHVVQVEGD
jgi:hypothetical protein